MRILARPQPTQRSEFVVVEVEAVEGVYIQHAACCFFGAFARGAVHHDDGRVGLAARLAKAPKKQKAERPPTRHHLMYNESLELTAPQHTAVKT
jgi:hypothetical protein